MTSIVYPNGSKTVTVAASEKIAVYAVGTSARVYQKVGYPNQPDSWSLLQTVTNSEYLSSAFTNATDVRIDAGIADRVLYQTGANPVVSEILPSIEVIKQGAPTAKTTDATLTAAEIAAGIITVNQGAGGASAQTLPLATAMDTAFPDVAAGYAFDFSVINISTVGAEDATMTTNTGWTLVGEMTVESNDSDRARSAGIFRARKTGTGAWTLYRIA